MATPNIFELQVEEMLTEVRPSFSLQGVMDALQRLKSLIEEVKPRELLPVSRFPLALPAF